MKTFLIKTAVAFLLFGGNATLALCRTATQEKIESLKDKEVLKTCVWGMFAMKANGDTIADFNRCRKMVPASNVKLISTGLALKTLGPDFRYETGLGYSGEIEGNTLRGDLYIIGGGDPTTASKADCADPLPVLFGKWLEIVRNAGISRIEGNVVGDPRFFSCMASENPGWLYEDLGSFDGAAPQGLNFYENTQKLTIMPGGGIGSRPTIYPIYPDTPWMVYINNAVTTDSNEPNTLYYTNTSFGPYGAVNGKFPIRRGGYGLDCDNQFGAYTCACYFFNYLTRNGIDISGSYADIDGDGLVRTDLVPTSTGYSASPDITVIGSTYSHPLAEILDETNRYSNNFFAETLLHTIGRNTKGSSEYDDCIDCAKRAFLSMGLSPRNSCRIVDGSGLSRKNYVSPEFFVQFLKGMAKEDHFGIYLSTLPQPGKKGTMGGFMPREPGETRARVHCKTGSMNGILCLSGYIEASDGNPGNMIVFSIMTNNSTASHWSVRAVLEEIVTSLCKEN